MNSFSKIMLALTFLLLAGADADAQKAGRKKNTEKTSIPVVNTGQQDREQWVKALYKIAWPVVHNLAAGTLKQNMPLELGPQYYLPVKKVTYLEAVGRTMAGLAPWLALPDDDTEEGKVRKLMRSE